VNGETRDPGRKLSSYRSVSERPRVSCECHIHRRVVLRRAHRRAPGRAPARGTRADRDRKGTRALSLSCRAQAVLVLRWFGDRKRVKHQSADNRMSLSGGSAGRVRADPWGFVRADDPPPGRRLRPGRAGQGALGLDRPGRPGRPGARAAAGLRRQDAPGRPVVHRDGRGDPGAVVEAVWRDTGIAAGHQCFIGGDEIAAVEALTGRLDLTDMVVTTDSLHSHERLARKIRARGSH